MRLLRRVYENRSDFKASYGYMELRQQNGHWVPEQVSWLSTPESRTQAYSGMNPNEAGNEILGYNEQNRRNSRHRAQDTTSHTVFHR